MHRMCALCRVCVAEGLDLDAHGARVGARHGLHREGLGRGREERAAPARVEAVPALVRRDVVGVHALAGSVLDVELRRGGECGSRTGREGDAPSCGSRGWSGLRMPGCSVVSKRKRRRRRDAY